MNYLVIGDVHGCSYTFKNLVKKHWDKENDVVVQLGDLIDRGRNSPQMIDLARQLSAEFPESFIFLKGNHEYEMIEHFRNQPNDNWLTQCGADTLRQYETL